MNRHAYGDAWRLAVALRRPEPRPSEVGDVMTDPTGTALPAAPVFQVEPVVGIVVGRMTK